MADKGWIKTYRKIQECWIWLDKEPFDKRSAWIDLLLTANHADKKILFNGELITIKRGQILTSIRKLADKWSWSVNKVYRFLELLISDEMLQKESDNNRTLITIVNYSIFQDSEYTDEHTNGNSYGDIGDTHAETVSNTHSEHKQECKELKNDKNVKNEIKKKKEDTNVSKKKESAVYYPNDEKLNQAFSDYVQMRKQIKKPMTERAIVLAMKKLKELSAVPFSDGMDNDLAIKILEQSTMNSWLGLFAIKESGSKTERGKRDLLQELMDA